MIDQNDLASFPEADQTRYKAYEELFATDGWRALVKDLSERTGQLVNSALSTINDEKDLFFQKGLVQASMMIINLEANIGAEIQARLQHAEEVREEEVVSQGSNA